MAYSNICDTVTTAHKKTFKIFNNVKLCKDLKTNQDLSKIHQDCNIIQKVKRADLKLARLSASNNHSFTLVDTLLR